MSNTSQNQPVITLSRQTRSSRIFYGYVVVLASFLIMVIIYGAQYSFGVFFKPMVAEFGWSRGETSGAYSLYMILCGVFGIMIGRLTDRLGPRLLLSFCAVIIGLGYILMSRSSTIWQMYLSYGVLVSLGSAGGWVPLLSTVAKWFDRRRGLMTGIVVAGIGMGVVIMPPVANQLITGYGWRTSYVVVGVIALVLTAIAAQFLKNNPNQINRASSSPATSEKTIAENTRDFTLHEAFRTRPFWLICAAFFSLGFSNQIVLVHLVPHATDIGFSPVIAALVLSLVGGLSIGSKVGIGFLIDRLGGKKIMMIVFTGIAVSFIWFQQVNQLWMLYVFAVIYATAYGASAAIQSPIIAEYFGVKAHGTIFGIANMATYIGCAIGPLMAGMIFDRSGSYGVAFITCIVMSIISLASVFFLTPTHRIQEGRLFSRG